MIDLDLDPVVAHTHVGEDGIQLRADGDPSLQTRVSILPVSPYVLELQRVQLGVSNPPVPLDASQRVDLRAEVPAEIGPDAVEVKPIGGSALAFVVRSHDRRGAVDILDHGGKRVSPFGVERQAEVELPASVEPSVHLLEPGVDVLVEISFFVEIHPGTAGVRGFELAGESLDLQPHAESVAVGLAPSSLRPELVELVRPGRRRTGQRHHQNDKCFHGCSSSLAPAPDLRRIGSPTPRCNKSSISSPGLSGALRVRLAACW